MTTDQLYDVRLLRDVKIPMRDGVRLSANVFLPDAPGAFPTVFQRTPYGASGYPDGAYWAQRGYAYLTQDCRGRFDSEGEFYPFVADADDGYDSLEWLVQQPWCNGRVGMYGLSYWGAVQWLLAPSGHPALQAISPSVIPGDFWRRGYWVNGAFSLALNALWLCLEVSSRTSDLNLIPAYDLEKFFSTLPLIDLDVQAGRYCQFWRDYLTHSGPGDFWRRFSTEGQHAKMQAPAYLMTGWYDNYPGEAFRDYTALRGLGKRAKLLVGPWSHIISSGTQLGEVDFGADSQLDLRAILLRWYDALLKDADDGILAEPPITLYVMGANAWRQEWEWPLARTRFTPYYLRAGGALSTEPPGREEPDRYVYDPADPVWTLGGNHSICWGEAYHVIQPGPFDQRPVEARDDVLSYTTPPLAEDTEVTGPVEVVLHASSSAPDTDFVVRLIDVHPDGRAMNLTEGVMRARFRASIYQPEQLLEPGTVYEFRIDMPPTSNVFFAGHRIRLDVTSSCFPLWDRNPNTGHPQGMDAELQPAAQAIHHEAAWPSHVLLPLLPR